MQKFFRGHRVKVAKKLPKTMDHFESDCSAIIQYSYSDIYDSDDTYDHTYSLLLLIGDENSWYTVSWYDEEHLTLMNNDRDAGEMLLQEHKILIRKLEDQMEKDLKKHMAKKL